MCRHLSRSWRTNVLRWERDRFLTRDDSLQTYSEQLRPKGRPDSISSHASADLNRHSCRHWWCRLSDRTGGSAKNAQVGTQHMYVFVVINDMSLLLQGFLVVHVKRLGPTGFTRLFLATT